MDTATTIVDTLRVLKKFETNISLEAGRLTIDVKYGAYDNIGDFSKTIIDIFNEKSPVRKEIERQLTEKYNKKGNQEIKEVMVTTFGKYEVIKVNSESSEADVKQQYEDVCRKMHEKYDTPIKERKKLSSFFDFLKGRLKK